MHIDEVLAHTFMRARNITRGRLGEDVLFRASGERDFTNVVKKARLFINGDIRVPQCMLVVTDELVQSIGELTEAELKEAYFSSLVELNVLLGTGAQLPSKSRWGSFTAANSEFTLGRMVHDVYGRAFLRAFRDASA